MCGFCGFTGELANSDEIINNMLEKIIHRGPDSAGVFNDGQVVLGFRRLSIVDLENGSQPMFNEDKTIAIVFNGEIYNHEPLRNELIEKGHIFANNSDTETIIHLYEEYGVKLLDHLRGMFAFVIYDMKNNELFAARDIFGVKPFYYTVAEDNLIFGSEIKSFLPHPDFKKEVNELALENYLTFQYSVLPETFFKGVYKLMPSHYLLFKDGKIKTRRYYDITFKPDNNLSLEDAVKQIDEVVVDSIMKHKTGDVEIGSFLSSGVDSSYVAACFKGDKTFTVGFDYGDYNEISYAKNLSEKIGIENFNKTITTEEYWEHLPKVQYQMDEPLADPSAIALYFVSELASKHVKVALSGEGADEFFGGYNIYKEPMDLKVLTNLPMPIRKMLRKFAELIPFSFKGKNFLIRGGKTLQQRFIGNANMFSKAEREKILQNPTGEYSPEEITKPFYDKVSEQDEVTQMQYIDLNLWMVGDILLKADKMSMAHSLEVRVPLLDREVFSVASKLPTNLKVTKDATKFAFRMAAKKHLPTEVASKKKLGFPVPIRIWLKDEKYYNKIEQAFNSDICKKYFKTDELIKLLVDHKNSKKDNSRKIWTVYIFLVWYEQYFQ